jgi:cytochrome c-type biogenesis protein CcmH
MHTLIFWLAASALVGVTLTLLLAPLFARRGSSAPSEREVQVDAFRQRLRALEAARGVGDLDEAGYSEARAEAERELLAELPPEAAKGASPRPNRWLAGAVLAVAVPAATVTVYLALGEHEAISPAATLSREALAELPPEQLVERLASTLADRPGDGDGWLILARAYANLERFEDATEAYAQAARSLGDRADLLVEWAEVEALAAGGRLAGAPAARLERALQIRPDHAPALWLSGMAAQEVGDFPTTVRLWERLLAIMPADAPPRASLEVLVSRARAAIDPAGDTDAPTRERPLRLPVRVSLDPALADRARPEDSVFVFARAVEGSGAPLAVTRLAVRELPATVTLDDAMAMLPNARLSDHRRVVVGARVSRSGEPTARSGDLEGRSGELSLEQLPTGPVEVVIRSEVP